MSSVEIFGAFPNPETVKAILLEEAAVAVAEAGEALKEAWEQEAHRQAVEPPIIERTATGVTAVIHSRDPVMRWLEKGTGMYSTARKTAKHMIVPRRKKALRFAGGTFSKRSRGMKPQRPLLKAKREVRPAVEHFYSNAAQRFAGRVAALIERR